MLIPLAAMALWKKIGIGFAIFVFLFGRSSKDDIDIAIEGATEYVYEDGRGSTVVSTVNHRQGMVVFINDGTDLIHYAMVSVDGGWVGDNQSTKNLDEKRRWRSLLFNPGERRIHKIRKLVSSDDDTEGGDFGTHHVEAHIYAADEGRARFLRKLEYELYISDTYRSAPEGSGMYWTLEIHPTYIGEGRW